MLEKPLTEADLDFDVPTTTPVAAAWTPGPNVTQHNGDAMPTDLVFFAPPPPEIGEVVTARSTLNARKRPMAALSRLLLGGFLGSLAYVGLSFLGVDVVWQVMAFAGIVALTWWLTGFKHQVTYVGKEGAAWLTCRGQMDRIVKSEVFRFDEAAELRTGQTRQYTNGVYSGTSYNFSWTDASGRKRFKLSGTYHGEKKPPKAKDPFHFAQAAERAWSLHLLARAQDELDKNGALHFPLGADWIAVGPGFLVLCRKGRQERWDHDEIGGITINDGTLKIKRIDAKEGWFSVPGRLPVPLPADGQRPAFPDRHQSFTWLFTELIGSSIPPTIRARSRPARSAGGSSISSRRSASMSQCSSRPT